MLEATVEGYGVATAALHLYHVVAEEKIAHEWRINQVVAKNDMGGLAAAIQEDFLQEEGVEGDVAVVGDEEVRSPALDVVQPRKGEARRGGLHDATNGIEHKGGLQLVDATYAQQPIHAVARILVRIDEAQYLRDEIVLRYAAQRIGNLTIVVGSYIVENRGVHLEDGVDKCIYFSFRVGILVEHAVDGLHDGHLVTLSGEQTQFMIVLG